MPSAGERVQRVLGQRAGSSTARRGLRSAATPASRRRLAAGRLGGIREDGTVTQGQPRPGQKTSHGRPVFLPCRSPGDARHGHQAKARRPHHTAPQRADLHPTNAGDRASRRHQPPTTGDQPGRASEAGGSKEPTGQIPAQPPEEYQIQSSPIVPPRWLILAAKTRTSRILA